MKLWQISTTFIVLLIVIIGGFLLFTNSEENQSEKQTVKMGIILPLSGSNAKLGEGARQAIDLLVPELQNKKYNYELLYEDDALDPKKTSNAANKLISFDKVDTIISLSSGSGNVVTPLAESNKIIHFGIASDSNVANGEYNFIHWTPPEEEVKLFISELQKRNIKSISVLALHQQGVYAIMNELQNKLANTDTKIVYQENFNFGEKDFRSAILKAEEKNPEIYMIMFFTPELELATKQLRELGITKPITSIEAISFTDQLNLFEGSWYVDAGDSTKEFTELYQNKYGHPTTLGAPNAYDIVNMLVSTYEKLYRKNQKPTATEVAKEISSIKNFPGVLGSLSVPETGIVRSPASIKIVSNGKIIPA